MGLRGFRKAERQGMRAEPMPAWAGGRRRPVFRAPRRLPRWVSMLAPVLVVLALAWLVSPLMPPPPEPLTGRARIVDGDTLRFGEDRVRLDGIDAPERNQTCKNAAGKRWNCGAEATDGLVALAGGRTITCAPSGHDRYRRIVAVCKAGNTDLGAAQVKAGLAVADGDYLAEEISARAGGRGIWAGRFERPADWRRAHPDGVESEGWPSPLEILYDWVRTVFFR
jgi:endonuclease YncB( thermonuclease family)